MMDRHVYMYLVSDYIYIY